MDSTREEFSLLQNAESSVDIGLEVCEVLEARSKSNVVRAG